MRIHQDINSSEDLFTWTQLMIVRTPGQQCGHIDVCVLCVFLVDVCVCVCCFWG